MSHLSLQSHMACGRCSVVVFVGGKLPCLHQSVISTAWVEGTQSSVLGYNAALAMWIYKAVGLTHDTSQGSLTFAWGKQELLAKECWHWLG